MFRRRDETVPHQTLREELANVITHGLGFILSIIACVLLVYSALQRGDRSHVASAVVYGTALVLLYLCSTLYHGSKDRAKEVLQRLDHICIYLLIAGTYMPIALISLKGMVGHILFGIECSLCFIGVTFKAIFGARMATLSGAFYLLMGWLVVVALEPLCLALPSQALLGLFLGGAFYTLGFVFFALDRKFHYFHTIWHVFVLAGSLSHFLTIFFYVMP